MSDKLRESLSALMDDEANELELERILSRIGGDSSLRETWVRYHAARSATSGQAAGLLHLDVSQRVSAALQVDEAVIQQHPMQRFLRPIGSFAVAASVAVAVVIGGQQLNVLGTEGSLSSPMASGPSPVGVINTVGAIPVRASYGTANVPELQTTNRTAYRELARQRMARYMQEHAEQAALNTPHGLVPFARVPQIKE